MIRKILFIGMFSCLALFLASCGGNNQAEAQAKAQTKEKAAKSDEVTEIVIQPVDNEMKYAKTEFTVKAGTKVRVVMDNIATSEAMHHNVVIMKPGTDKQEIGMAALQAGEAKGYIPDKEAILFYTPMSAPGEKQSVEFTAPAPGDYPYICTFPGHWATMQGVMHVVK